MRRVRLALVPLVLFALLPAIAASAEELFFDDFGGGLDRWRVRGGDAVRIVDSGDPEHGAVLELQPDGLVFALIRGSQAWGPVAVEGEVLFPKQGHSYLGLIYNFSDDRGRTDFGSIYIKGNGSYLRANPWRDGNASRLLYEEYRTPLRGAAAIEIGAWQRFRFEVQSSRCDVYVGDLERPQLTFSLYERDSGMLGFKPRIVGQPVWLDDVRVRSLARLTYDGPPLPEVVYDPSALLDDWTVLGPFPGPVEAIETADPVADEVVVQGHPLRWRPFPTDARGAVLTGRVTEYLGTRPVAYYRTVVERERAGSAILHLTTADELGLWVNGRFQGFVYRDGYVSGDNDWNAWHDFWRNPEHAGRRVPVDLVPGRNVFVLRARNGAFAAGGFFARLEAAADE